MFDTIRQDLHLAVRRCQRRPSATLLTVATLALGIGATTAVFSVLSGVLLAPLPFEEPERLVHFVDNQSPPDVEEVRTRSGVFEAVGGYSLWNFDLVGAKRPERIPGAMVTPGLLEALRVQVAEGRLFTPAEHRLGADRALVASAAFQRRRYPDAATLVGRELSLNGRSYTVVGVLPESFRFVAPEVELFVPLAAEYPIVLDVRGAHFLRTAGRLAEGVELAAARTALAGLAAQLAEEYPAEDTGLDLGVLPLKDLLVRDVQGVLWILFAAVGLVLTIACLNVAHLQLAKLLGRQQEMAVRTALGANRSRLVKQLLIENLLLAVVGGGAGLLVASWGMDGLVALAGDRLPRAGELALDRTVLLFSLALSLGTGLALGLGPALLVGARASLAGLRTGVSKAAGGRGQSRLSGTLVLVQVTLALVLAIGAGLLVRSFQGLLAVAPGFRFERVLTVRLALPEARYPAVADQLELFGRLLPELEALPGIATAAVVSDVPLEGAGIHHDVAYSGGEDLQPGEEPNAWSRDVSEGFFAALEVRPLAGRLFDSRDRELGAPVAIVNQGLADAFWPGKDALGEKVRWARQPDGPWLTVVGVVPDLKWLGFDRGEGLAIYTPMAQKPMAWKRTVSLVLDTEGPPLAVLPEVEEAIWAFDPELALPQNRTLDAVAGQWLGQRKLALVALNTFAGVALALAALGIYGVLSHAVSRRTREIGIRMALGADRGRLLGQVVGGTLGLVGAGVVAGWMLARVLGRSLESLLYGVTARDPFAFTAATVLLFAVALAAAWLPARRAANVEPVVALRED